MDCPRLPTVMVFIAFPLSFLFVGRNRLHGGNRVIQRLSPVRGVGHCKSLRGLRAGLESGEVDYSTSICRPTPTNLFPSFLHFSSWTNKKKVQNVDKSIFEMKNTAVSRIHSLSLSGKRKSSPPGEKTNEIKQKLLPPLRSSISPKSSRKINKIKKGEGEEGCWWWGGGGLVVFSGVNTREGKKEPPWGGGGKKPNKISFWHRVLELYWFCGRKKRLQSGVAGSGSGYGGTM